MAVMICHASLDENKNIKGGQAGDQTGKEVCIREWWNKPWNVLIRFKDPQKAEKVALCMENAAKNDNLGYSQDTRNSLLKEARKYNYDVSKVNVPCNCDCSSLVSVACMYAGVPESSLTLNGNCAHTRNIRAMLKATGLVDVYTTVPYLAKSDRLKRGDILCAEGKHIVVVVKTDTVVKKSLEEVAKEIIQGKGGWGNGSERRIRLIDAGYNPDEVQRIVNTLLHANKDKSNEQIIWDFLLAKIGNPKGVAGLMGNIKAESNFNPKNLQNSFEKKLGLNDETYTVAVDNGAYSNFASDSAGYGICQWSSSGRKASLLKFKGSQSIGNLQVQLEFLWHELSSAYRNVLKVLKTTRSVVTASDTVLTKFERPKDQSQDVKDYRAKLSMEIYQRNNKGV